MIKGTSTPESPESLPAASAPGGERAPRAFYRRLVTVPAYLFAALAYSSILPVLLILALVVDVLGRRRLATIRALTMVEVYLLCEAAGILAGAWIWLRHRDHDRFLDANFRLQCWWAGTLYRAGLRLFSLNVRVDGAEAVLPGPIVILSRHVSVIDNLLPAVLVSEPHGIRLRWVINRSLLRDPCLDIVGNRLPNCFVSNSGGDSEAEIARVARLATGLESREGLLIFPEGALFSPRRRERVLQRLEGGDPDLLARARAMRNVLPPRLGGSLAALEAADGVDVVFLAHAGLEDSTSYRAILGGGLIGRRIDVAFWRVPAAQVPRSPAARTSWLLDQWQVLDEWVTSRSTPTGEVVNAR